MSSHRSLRMAQAIREVVSSAILFEVADPRVRDVTVLRVEVAGDLRSAVAFVSVMGSEAEQDRALQGLHHATGFLQSRVAARLQTRFTPVLSFKRDDSVKKSIEMSRMIEEALAADRQASGSAGPADRDPSDVPGGEADVVEPGDRDVEDPSAAGRA